MKKIATAMIAGCICLLSLSACAGEVHVKTHHGWMGPSTWEATDGKTSVRYYNGDCCCVAENVLISLAEKANRKELDWSKMADPKFQAETLSAECKVQQGKR